VASNDDANGTFLSALTVNLQAGTTYWFMVATGQPGASNLHLSLRETAPLPRVANDDFDSATQISSTPYGDTIDASGATAAQDDPLDCYGTHGSVWYAFTPSVSGTVDVSTGGSTYDTALGVYEGPRGSLFQVACDDNSDPMLTSHVSFKATGGSTYYLLVVAAWNETPRTLQLSVSLTPTQPPLTLKVSYDPQAPVDGQAGTAVVTGTIGCSRSARTTITASVGQQLGQSAPRAGRGTVIVSCSTKLLTRFSVTVASTSSPGLSDGPAGVRLVASGCDAFGCTKTTASGDLQLVKKLK
jgi:hypothetical protein